MGSPQPTDLHLPDGVAWQQPSYWRMVEGAEAQGESLRRLGWSPRHESWSTVWTSPVGEDVAVFRHEVRAVGAARFTLFGSV